MPTKIEWTDETWNVASGCTRVSEGCRNCYIEATPPFRIEGRHFTVPCEHCGGTGFEPMTGKFRDSHACSICNPFNPFERGHPHWETRITRVGKKAAGRDLDGRTWDEYPEVDR